jgi:hypothetical protein
MEARPVGADMVRTDGQTDMTKAGDTVRQYASAFRKTTGQDWDSQMKCNCAVFIVM